MTEERDKRPLDDEALETVTGGAASQWLLGKEPQTFTLPYLPGETFTEPVSDHICRPGEMYIEVDGELVSYEPPKTEYSRPASAGSGDPIADWGGFGILKSVRSSLI